MIHVRAVSPPDLTERVEELLGSDPYVLNLIVQRGAARNPDGDSVACDVLAGAANEVLRGLRDLRVDLRGSVVVEPVDMAFPGTGPGRRGAAARGRSPACRSGSRWRRASGPGGGTRRASTSIWSSRA